MASKTQKLKRAEAPPAAPAAGVWDAKLRPLLERRAVILGVLLIAIGAARIAATWSRFSFTNDEPQHFASGVEYLQDRTYFYEPEQPPLSRLAMALLPYIDGSRLTGKHLFVDREGVAIMYQHRTPQRTLVLMRLGILPFFLLAGAVVFLWARHHFGGPAAVVATALFSCEPTILAHAGLATADMALAACLPAAFFAMILWAEHPTRRNTLFFGTASGLALLAKFTALIYLPAAAVFALLWYVAVNRPGAARLAELARERAGSFALAVLAGVVIVWAGYLFDFGKFSGGRFPVPAPQLWQGISDVLRHNSGGHPAFLLGHMSQTGWWYYFPVALAFKTPIAYLLLAIFGVIVCVRRVSAAWALPVAFSLGVLVPAMMGNINIGLRHILPVYAGLSIAGGVAVVQLAKWAHTKKWAAPIAVAALLWVAATGIWNHPYYLAYFNELAGSHPEKILVDSDLDWSQDYVEVAGKLRAMNVREVNFGVGSWLDPYFEFWPGFPKIKPLQPMIPASGWVVVSPSTETLNQYGLMHRFPNLEPYWEKLTPVGKVGSMLFYYVPPGSIRLKQEP